MTRLPNELQMKRTKAVRHLSIPDHPPQPEDRGSPHRPRGWKELGRGPLCDFSQLWWTLLLGVFLWGCAAPIDESWRNTPPLPYRTVPPPDDAPPLVHCNDRTGHREGAAPWIFGGTCLCNPSSTLLSDYHRQGILRSWSVDTLEGYYRRRGVSTRRDHQRCNNLCSSGPHILKGGRCLVPPTPGTLNWEEVVTGEFSLPPWDQERVTALGGPLARDPLPPSGNRSIGNTAKEQQALPRVASKSEL